jgi:hypothetical protein
MPMISHGGYQVRNRPEFFNRQRSFPLRCKYQFLHPHSSFPMLTEHIPWLSLSRITAYAVYGMNPWKFSTKSICHGKTVIRRLEGVHGLLIITLFISGKSTDSYLYISSSKPQKSIQLRPPSSHLSCWPPCNSDAC